MSTEASRTGPAPGALLLCRSDPESVALAARLLRERMLLMRAGEDWSVLVPEGKPWQHAGEPVDRVVTGWATALAVGAAWPVIALWWDADRAGYALAVGFRRPVGYVWLANGTPAGEEEAMRTFAARLGLDPMLDMRSLEQLTKPDPNTDARARVRGLLAVLNRAGVELPAGLLPGEPADRLRAMARVQRDARQVEVEVEVEGAEGTERKEGREGREGRSATVRGDLEGGLEAVGGARPLPRLPWAGTPQGRALAFAQVAAGLPLTAWGLRHRSGGWITAGALLLAHGALGLAYDLTHPRD